MDSSIVAQVDQAIMEARTDLDRLRVAMTAGAAKSGREQTILDFGAFLAARPSRDLAALLALAVMDLAGPAESSVQP